MPLFGSSKPKSTWVPGAAPTIQNAYVDARLAAIASERDVNVRTALECLDADLKAWILHRTPSIGELREAYQKIQMNLQAADLTINFNSRSWFTYANHYDTYMQMYERGVDDLGQVRMTANAMNDVHLRVLADDEVTIPREWDNNQPVKRGLAPRQNEVRIRQKMQFGGAVNVPALRPQPGRTGKVTTENPHFDPKSKQIFAALNYGRCPRGAAAGYGFSFLVLKSDLKPRALYYPADTFGLRSTRTAMQMSYPQLGTIYGKFARMEKAEEGEKFRKTLLDACYRSQVMNEHTHGMFLLEAHIFGEVRFSEAVVSVNVSKEKGTNDEESWQRILANATAFAKKHHIKLNVLG